MIGVLSIIISMKLLRALGCGTRVKNVRPQYVFLSPLLKLKERPKLTIDKQHNDMSWFDLSEIAGKDGFHKYMQSYASWLINEY